MCLIVAVYCTQKLALKVQRFGLLSTQIMKFYGALVMEKKMLLDNHLGIETNMYLEIESGHFKFV